MDILARPALADKNRAKQASNAKGAYSVQTDEDDRVSVQVATAQMRRLAAPDEPAVLDFLSADGGYGLFIASNMLSYGLTSGDLRFWGLYQPGPDMLPRLAGVLMLAGHNANLYVLPGVDPDPLIAEALHERLHFIMGEETTMARAQEWLGHRVVRVEQHFFAELPTQRFHPTAPLPTGVRVRRAAPRDVDALARLYFNTSGFEDLAYPQVRSTMMNSVTHLRTYLAEMDGRVVAAASTSAESYSAAMVGGVWTAPHARGRGLSTAVVAALCADLLRERKRPHLFYLIDNAPAARVYAKLGFRVTGGWKVVYSVS